jgi:SAM-dependent methyltransferase
LSEFTGAEFTGERVIPELVDADLFNEHLARYRFANRFAARLGETPHVLDAGCGTGYGTAELVGAGSITATDISSDAIRHALSHYGHRRVRFLQAACEALPFEADTFDLVVAFEVIEHIERWPDLVTEANRVLKPAGVLLVSTPNRDAYAESRGTAGPNPFHCHEFDYEEFRQALGAVFPHVSIWTQNHAGAIVFSPQESGTSHSAVATLDNDGSASSAEEAQFYLAACSQTPIANHDLYAWLPSTGNVLRERERHIAKLHGELQKKDAWLRQSMEAHGDLQGKHEALLSELERQNSWAGKLNREVASRDGRIAELQEEHARRLAWIEELEAQIVRANAERSRLESEALAVRQDAQAEIRRRELEYGASMQAVEGEMRRLEAESVESGKMAHAEIRRLEAEAAELRQTAQAAIRRAEAESLELTRKAEIEIHRLVAEAAELVETTQAEITRLESEGAELKQTAEAEISRLESEGAELKQTAQAEITRLESEGAELKQTAQAEITRLESDCAELKQTAQARISRLESEIAELKETAQAEIRRIEAERTELARTARAEISRLELEADGVRQGALAEIRRLEATVAERSLWALRQDEEVAKYREDLGRLEASRWVRVGAKLGLVPRLRNGQ